MPYGIYEGNIDIPVTEHKPILLIQNENNIITPTGKISAYYHSEEFKLINKLNYKFTIMRGFIFNTGPIAPRSGYSKLRSPSKIL